MDDHALYQEVEARLAAFSGPIDDLNRTLRAIPDQDLRKTTCRCLGEVMGQLETIAYEFRKHLGTKGR